MSVCLSLSATSCVCLVSLHACLSTDALSIYSPDISVSQVEIDRRMLDFCVGLDTEFSEIVEGSHLYFPKTKFEQVYGAQEHTKDVCL